MKTMISLRPLTLSAVLLATLSLTAHAAVPQTSELNAADRGLLREAEGEYTLADGRTLKLHVGAKQLNVGLDARPLETWKAASNGLLVSPDGKRRVRLYRNPDGSVDHIAYEAERGVR